jgi:CRISPR system Cascade subunit CasC
MFVELHMIQNFSPSNLNRDDTNNPKDCEFGGVRRARISSQCIKRAIRTSLVFSKVTGVEPATRTRLITRLLRQKLLDDGRPGAEVDAVVPAFVDRYAADKGAPGLDKEGRTRLIYLSDSEVGELVTSLLANWQALADAETRGSAIAAIAKPYGPRRREFTSAPDVALFGRMLTAQPQLDLDAACQVAHAISTHRVTMDMDFFTAVDDLQESEETGAGMMGFVGFDSACFYRYARIDWRQLVRTLRGDRDLALRTVEGFLRASLAAVPSGKQNSFAAHNPPSLSLAVVRRDGMGWSLANAFQRPVRAERDGGLVAPSVAALDRYWGRMCDVYGTSTLVAAAALALEPDLPLERLHDATVANVNQWVSAVTGALPAEGVGR